MAFSGWSHKVSVTVKLDKTLARVKLSNMPTGFFSIVQDGGGDIRVTKSNGITEVARDVRSCDTTAEDGWLVFATGESKSATTGQYWVYIGNPGASDYAVTDTYGRNNTYDSQYAAVLSMDEDPSGTPKQMKDRTGNGNDGTTIGSMVTGDSVAGQMDNALEFNGTTQWVEVADDNTLDLTALTMGVTFKESGSSAGWTSLMAKRNQASGTNYGMSFNPDGGTNIFQLYFLDGTFQAHQISWSANFNDNTWYHVTGTLAQNGADVDSAIYKDGVSLDTKTFLSKTLTGNTAKLYIAAAYTTFEGDEELNGQVDEVYLMNVAIGSAEADAIADEIMDNANAITFGTSLVANGVGQSRLSMNMGMRL